jgi:hypothetical protein
MKTDHIYMDRYLERLGELPFVDELDFESDVGFPAGTRWMPDGLLTVTSGRTRLRFLVEIEDRLDYAVADRIAGLAAELPRDRRIMLLVPYVSAPLAEYLDKKDLNFADLAGNCRIKVGRTRYVFITGRKSASAPSRSLGARAQGVQLLFALLARPDLVAQPVREIAALSGVSKSTAANRILALEHEGFIGHLRGTRLLIGRDRLLERWIGDFARILEPRLCKGRYMTPYSEPTKRERIIKRAPGLQDLRWGWGGLTAAYKLIRHYRDDSTVLFVESWSNALARDIRALPASDGHLLVYRAPGPTAFDGETPDTVHPLLIYAQLVNSTDERARETGRMVYDLYLKEGER